MTPQRQLVLDAVRDLGHATPEQVWALVSDVTRTGEWSPVCRRGTWHEGAGPWVGAWFTGHNEADGVAWDTESQVVVADPEREFAWLVGGRYARWAYRWRAVEGGTELTETWDFLPEGRAMFAEKYGDGAAERFALRQRQARHRIPASLAAIRDLLDGSAAADRADA